VSISRDELYKRYKYRKLMEKNGCKFNSYLINSFKGQFKLISQYDGYNSIVKIKCNHCGFTIDNKTPLQFKRNPGCPICDSQIKQTEKSFMWRLQNLYGNQYTLLSDFKNVDTQAYLFHKDCGKVIKIYPKTLLTGSQCYYCYGNDRLGLVELYKRVHQINKDLILINGYSVRRKVKVRYLSCGHIRVNTIRDIDRRPYCPICVKAMDRRKRALGFARNIGMYGFVSLRSIYTNMTHDVTVQCNRCGYTWDTNPGPLAVGHGCPKCSSSRGEAMIAKILDKHHIAYEYPKKFEDLRAKRLLHYDFYLPEYNVLIEYQGKQHYESVNYFGGDYTFKKQQKHDEMKRKYAKEHGYHLLEISYKYDTLKSIERKINNYLGGINHG
jgi:predicted Zn-ribbon and HTH transcriptional regulator